jgi:hypothetical protein
MAKPTKYDILFTDTLTAASRLSFAYAENSPDAVNERGKKDLWGAYGAHVRQMLAWLYQLQQARNKHVIFIVALEKVTDKAFNTSWEFQIEGNKTGREMPGIVDEVLTMAAIDFGDGKPVRAFVCTSPNPWGFPAKDRSGRLEQVEEPNLGKLITKLTAKQPITPAEDSANYEAEGAK